MRFYIVPHIPLHTCTDILKPQTAIQWLGWQDRVSANARRPDKKGKPIMITVLLVILLLMAIGAFPSWNHSRRWGYFPSGGLGLVVLAS
jgi:hypothetical protein